MAVAEVAVAVVLTAVGVLWLDDWVDVLAVDVLSGAAVVSGAIVVVFVVAAE